jgi:hypothetical protein
VTTRREGLGSVSLCGVGLSVVTLSCALGVAKCVFATWHSKLGRSETRRWGDRLRDASAGRLGVGRRCARVSIGIGGRYRSWSRRRVR